MALKEHINQINDYDKNKTIKQPGHTDKDKLRNRLIVSGFIIMFIFLMILNFNIFISNNPIEYQSEYLSKILGQTLIFGGLCTLFAIGTYREAKMYNENRYFAYWIGFIGGIFGFIGYVLYAHYKYRNK